MFRIFAFFKRLIQGDSTESSKRFLAVYCGLILVTYLVFRFANEENIELILGEILSFILVLFGVATWQKISENRKK